MQQAIERQQASLSALLEQKKSRNDVNDREHEGNSSKNKFATLPSIVSECNAPPNYSARALQNYDQHRDSKRAAYSTYDHFLGSRQSNNAPSHNRSVGDHLLHSAINEKAKQKFFSDTNSPNEVMARGRHNRNRNNRGSNYNKRNQNNHKNGVLVSEQSVAAVPQIASEEKISKENSSHTITSNSARDDENSCSINSLTDNTDDNITAVAIASDVNEKTAPRFDDKSMVNSVDGERSSSASVESYDESQQVKRVSFAPSPRSRTISIESMTSDDDEEEEEDEATTISEDIFYEANSPEVKILSTVTSHNRIDEEETPKDASVDDYIPKTITSMSLEQANKSNNNSDVVCAKIILSVNENDGNDGNAFSSSSESDSISNDEINDSPPKTIKPSYKLVGDETIALPDILDSALPDILLEQQSHIVDADV